MVACLCAKAGSTPFIAIQQTDKRQLFLATGKLRTILPERFATIWEYRGCKRWAVSSEQKAEGRDMRVKIHLLTGGVKFAAIAVVFVCASAALSPSRAAKPQTNSTNAAQTNASPQPNSNVTSQTESRATAQTNSNTTPQPQSEAERFVLEQVLLGNRVDLKKKFPQSSNERQLRGEFLKALLTSTEINSKVPISISNAVIPHQFDLAGAEVHPDVQFIDCVFVGPLQFDKSHFNGNLSFLNSDLRLGIELNQATIDRDLMLVNCQVLQISFLSLNVGRDLFL